MPLVKSSRVNEEARLEICERSKLDQRDRFNASKLLQTDINAWRDCEHKKCGEKQTCLGGPRGTCARTGGFTLCSHEGKSRMRQVPRGERWERDELYDTESLSERAERRSNERMAHFEVEMMKAKILAKKRGIDVSL